MPIIIKVLLNGNKIQSKFAYSVHVRNSNAMALVALLIFLLGWLPSIVNANCAITVINEFECNTTIGIGGAVDAYIQVFAI